MADKIYTGLDLAHRDGAKNHGEWMRVMCQRMGNMLETPYTGKTSGEAVQAEINYGRWVSRCPECAGVEYVSPDEKIFFCFSCGNYTLGGDARPVVFPDGREEIEAEVLSREVSAVRGVNALDRALKAKEKVPGLSRSWKPGETVEDLKQQKKAARDNLGV